mmetsp:Transcript_48462/g.90322  ORF Transcript_48462/g.90322 Transcript_48462/m.90322 type:complete len:265 (-) Transcript_48462:244-1038(-)
MAGVEWPWLMVSRFTCCGDEPASKGSTNALVASWTRRSQSVASGASKDASEVSPQTTTFLPLRGALTASLPSSTVPSGNSNFSSGFIFLKAADSFSGLGIPLAMSASLFFAMRGSTRASLRRPGLGDSSTTNPTQGTECTIGAARTVKYDDAPPRGSTFFTFFTCWRRAACLLWCSEAPWAWSSTPTPFASSTKVHTNPCPLFPPALPPALLPGLSGKMSRPPSTSPKRLLRISEEPCREGVGGGAMLGGRFMSQGTSCSSCTR